jgi:periplasmic copper chaperone A
MTVLRAAAALYRVLALSFVAAASAVVPAMAQPGSETISIATAWAHPTREAARTGVAYLSIINNGKGADRLLGARTPIADSAAVHEYEMDGDRVRRRAVGALEVPPGETIVLKPTGLHLMLMGLKHALKPDERFPLTLVFERAGPVETTVTVRR